MAIKPKLQSLLASANDVTGEERTNLTDAVQDLVDGYGQGGELPSTEVSYKSNENYRGLYISNGNGFLATNTQYYRWGMLYKSNKTQFVFNPASATNNIRVCCKIKTPPVFESNKWPVAWITSQISTRGIGTECFCAIGADSTHGFVITRVLDSNNKENYKYFPAMSDTWYYVCIYQTQTTSIFSLYAENGNLLYVYPCLSNGFKTCTSPMTFGGINGASDDWTGSIDIAESFFEIDGVCVWGKTNSKTANMGAFDFSSPSSFTKTECLTSDGTGQIILTNIIPTTNTKIVLKAKNTAKSNNPLFGVMENSDYNFGCGSNSALTNYYFIYKNSGWAMTGIVPDDDIHEFMISNGLQAIDNNQVGTYTSSSFPSSSSYKIPIFGRYYQTSLQKTGAFDLIDFQHYEENVLVENMLPVYHTETGVKGLFDIISNNFYGNASTGDFSIPSDTSGEINLAEYLASLT